MENSFRFFAPASRGTETVLAGELDAMGAGPTEIRRGGVAFGSRLEHGYRACLWSRVASRVLMPLTAFEADDAASLYAGVHAVAWTDHVGPERTLAVSVAGAGAAAGPSHFVALKSKDAIVDRVREAEGARPDVDKARPDVRVHIYVRERRVQVSLDLAGRGLHHRGVERRGAAAPLRENLAAAVLRLCGWHDRVDDTPLFDPMCGSATLLIEAAGMALDIAPGLVRDRIGLEGWRGHDAALWNRLRAEAEQRRQAGARRRLRIFGVDASRQALRTAEEILTRAGLSGRVRVSAGDLTTAEPPVADPGLVVTNPPYGERLGETGELEPLYERLGDVLKRRFPGWTAWVLTGNPALAKRIGLRPAARHVLFNGPIECRLLEIPISATPVTQSSGPGWRKPTDASRGFAKRLRRNLAQRSDWARSEDLTCYRLYDSDVPEYNLAVDWYDGAVRVEEYAAPRKIEPREADQRLRDAVRVVSEVLEIAPEAIVVRVRRRLGKTEQHQRYADSGKFREVREAGLRFRVNLSDYMDTGLFLDDRLLRRRIAERAAGTDFLNLFAYTCAASVAAAAGGARSTTSVDLSRTYLDWGRRNFELNSLDSAAQQFVRGDALRFGSGRSRGRRYGTIFVAPPTRSRSKAMAAEFDVQRDHGPLLNSLVPLVDRDGEIFFSTNLRDFVLDQPNLRGLEASEITAEITPVDFSRRPRLRAWSLRPAPRRPVPRRQPPRRGPATS